MKVKKSLDIDILIFSVFVRQTSTGHSTVGNTSTALYCVLYSIEPAQRRKSVYSDGTLPRGGGVSVFSCGLSGFL